MYGPMGVFEVIKSWRVTERCSFFNQRLFLELFADETIAKIPSHGTNGEINPTWIGWFSVGFHVNIPYMDPMGWLIEHQQPWLVGLPFGDSTLYTLGISETNYKNPPFLGSFPGEKNPHRYMSSGRPGQSSLWLPGASCPWLWRLTTTSADDFGWQKCLNLNFLVGTKHAQIFNPI